MNHAQVSTLLGDYMEGDLATAEHTVVDAHLEGCPSCSRELHDLRNVVGLVRGLPDPKPPTDLAGAVMARIEAGEGARRLRLLPGGLRRFAEPRFAAALAAGCAGLLAWTMLPSLSDPAGVPETPDIAAERGTIQVAEATAPRVTAGDVSEPARRPVVRRRSPAVPLLARAELPRPPSAFRGGVAPTTPVFDVDPIDRQLERMLIDPTSALNRMGRSPRGDLFARLTQRAARQGRAAELASRLISSPHPMANGLASRLLAASLAEDVRSREIGVVPAVR